MTVFTNKQRWHQQKKIKQKRLLQHVHQKLKVIEKRANVMLQLIELYN